MPNQTWTNFLLDNAFKMADGIPQAIKIDAIDSRKPALFDLSEYGFAIVSGKDAKVFLQGQLSNDIADLSEETPHQLSAYCNPKGRMLAIFHVVKLASEQGYGLIAPQSILDKALPRLTMFVMRSAVNIERAEDSVILGVNNHAEKPFMEENTFSLTSSSTRQFILCDVKKAQTIWQAADALTLAGSNEWRALDIMQAAPQIYLATHEALIPQSVNLDLAGGVNFKKGCYPGQEIIARVKYRGKPKTRMIAVQSKSNDDIAIGAPIFIDGRESSAGMVLNIADEVDSKLLSISVPISHLHEGTLFLGESKEIELQRLPLPYEIPA